MSSIKSFVLSTLPYGRYLLVGSSLLRGLSLSTGADIGRGLIVLSGGGGLSSHSSLLIVTLTFFLVPNDFFQLDRKTIEESTPHMKVKIIRNIPRFELPHKLNFSKGVVLPDLLQPQ